MCTSPVEQSSYCRHQLVAQDGRIVPLKQQLNQHITNTSHTAVSKHTDLSERSGNGVAGCPHHSRNAMSAQSLLTILLHSPDAFGATSTESLKQKAHPRTILLSVELYNSCIQLHTTPRAITSWLRWAREVVNRTSPPNSFLVSDKCKQFLIQ